MNARKVVVCGAGIVGLCTAYYLAKEGYEVVIIERNSQDAGSCAHGSAGYISPSHVAPLAAPGMVWQGVKWMLSSRSPFYIKARLDPELVRWGWLFARSCTPEHTRRAAPLLRDLCLASRSLFVELAAQTDNSFELRTEGLLNLCKTPQTLEHETKGLAALANEFGIEARVLTPQQTAEHEPGARVAVAGSIYFPIDAHLTPSKLVTTLIDVLQQQGVQFHWNTSVEGWQTAADRVTAVVSSKGALTADEYVITTGSWAPGTLRGLHLCLPMQPGKGYSLTIEQPRVKLRKPLILVERRVAVTPMGDSLRFGGTMELSGHSEKVLPQRIEQIKRAAYDYFPELGPADFAATKPWFGYRPVSPDGLPYIGRLARYKNLSVASGHAMLGVTLAPITGVLIADLLAGRRPRIDTALLDPNRFT